MTKDRFAKSVCLLYSCLKKLDSAGEAISPAVILKWIENPPAEWEDFAAHHVGNDLRELLGLLDAVGACRHVTTPVMPPIQQPVQPVVVPLDIRVTVSVGTPVVTVKR